MYTEELKIPAVKYRYSQGNGYSPKREGEFFIKGPLPMDWISKAALLPGKAVQVGLVLWWFAGMRPQQKIKVTRQALKLLNVSNDAYRDALSRLEEVGLVKVFRTPGQRATVEIVHNGAKEKHPGP